MFLKKIKVAFHTNKEGGNNNKMFEKLFRTTVVSMSTKCYNQLKFLNLVTMATTKIVYQSFVMLIKKEVMNILVFGIYFKTTMVSMTTKA